MYHTLQHLLTTDMFVEDHTYPLAWRFNQDVSQSLLGQHDGLPSLAARHSKRGKAACPCPG